MNNEKYATSTRKTSCYETGLKFLEGDTIPPVPSKYSTAIPTLLQHFKQHKMTSIDQEQKININLCGYKKLRQM